MIKIFVYAFWGEQVHSKEQASVSVTKLLLAIVPLVALTIILGFAAEPVFNYSLDVADQLLNPEIYINSVLGE